MPKYFYIIILLLIWPAWALVASRHTSEANLRFSHKTHSLNNVDCAQCHVDQPRTHPQAEGLPPGWQPLRSSPIVATQTKLIDNIHFGDSFGRPGEKRCLQCHFQTREKSDCGLCHMQTPGYTERTRIRLDDIYNFSHEKHQQFDCARCHPSITSWENLDGHYIKGKMRDCLECHDGNETPKNCVICHSPTPRPANHTRNFEHKHGLAYRSDPHSCKMCHEDSSCMDCHSRKPPSHTLAWTRYRHGIAARTNPQRCQACHSDPWVCARCHDNM